MTEVENLLPRDGEVFYVPGFFAPAVADVYYERLREDVDWRVEAIRIFGKEIPQPRRTAWYGEKDYRYSNLLMQRRPWLPVLLEIKSALEDAAKTSFNGVLLNHYRDGRDSMGWHRDNEPELGVQPVIASVSLGESRRFLLRHREERSLKVGRVLEHGSLLVMRGRSQECWEHALPKSSRPLGPRINLTFRQVLDL